MKRVNPDLIYRSVSTDAGGQWSLGRVAERGLLITALLLGWLPFCFGQRRGNGLANYENVSIDTSQHRVYYEQRLYRNPLLGMLELSKLLTEKGISEFVPLFQGIPIARYGLRTGLSTISRSERAVWASEHPFGGKAYKIDFRLQPEFIAQFGFREQPLESKTNLLVQSQLYIRRGLVLNWGFVIPVENSLDSQDLRLRPAPTFFNQFLALGRSDFVSVSAGLFYNNQYGLNAQYRHADLATNWSFGIESGLTGFYFFSENTFYHGPLKQLLLLGDVAYRIPARDITLKLSGGQYLLNDRGVRLDFVRQMGSVEIGFYATKTGNGTTGGFNFAIPIPPGRIAQTRRVRLRSTEEFRWEYAYTRGYNIASRYRVGYQLDAMLRQYHQRYLQNQYR